MRRRLRVGGRRVEAGAATRGEVTHRDQTVVGFDDGEAADLMTFGKIADRRQLRAGPQMPVVDLALGAGDDRRDEGLLASLNYGEGEHAGLPSSWTGLVVAPAQLCRLTVKLSLTVSATVRHCAAPVKGKDREPLDLSATAHSNSRHSGRVSMPLIQVRVIKDVFSKEQKRQIISKLTDAMVSIEGENMRGVTWCVVEEVESGDWGIGGNALTTADVPALPRGKAASRRDLGTR